MDPGRWPAEGLCVYVVSFSGVCQGGKAGGDMVNSHGNMHVCIYILIKLWVQRGNATAVLGRVSLMEGINLA